MVRRISEFEQYRQLRNHASTAQLAREVKDEAHATGRKSFR